MTILNYNGWFKDLNNPTQVCTTDTNGNINCQMFDTFLEAKKVYPTLDMHKNTHDFTWAMFNGNADNGKPIMRFEDWKTEEVMSK